MGLTYEDIADEFKNRVNSDKYVQRYLRQIRDGKASYNTANKLAVRVGKNLGEVLKLHAPIENIDEWDYIDLIPKSLGLDHQIIADACRAVQENINADAGLSIKPQTPKFDKNRVYGLIKELEDNPEFTNIEKSFYEQLVNFSESIVDDSIRENAGLMYRAGIKTMVVRQADSNCCPWCEEVAGTYDYDDVKQSGSDVWRRHENCRCTIDYITERNGSFYRESK